MRTGNIFGEGLLCFQANLSKHMYAHEVSPTPQSSLSVLMGLPQYYHSRMCWLVWGKVWIVMGDYLRDHLGWFPCQPQGCLGWLFGGCGKQLELPGHTGHVGSILLQLLCSQGLSRLAYLVTVV